MIKILLDDDAPLRLELFPVSVHTTWIQMADRWAPDCGRPWKSIKRQMQRALDLEVFVFEIPAMEPEYLVYFLWQLHKIRVYLDHSRKLTPAELKEYDLRKKDLAGPSDPMGPIPMDALLDAIEGSCNRELARLDPMRKYYIKFLAAGAQEPPKPSEFGPN